jgi:hypothetical protein
MQRTSAALFLFAALAAPALDAGTLYASRADVNELWTIDTLTFQTQFIGSYTVANPNEFGIPQITRIPDGRLYGLSTGWFSGSLYELDVNTAAATELSALSMPIGPLAMATDAAGLVWWINTGGFFPAPQLFSIDPQTFQVGIFGNIGSFTETFSGMVFDASGTLYALETSTNSLWVIDPSNPTGPGSHPVGPGFGTTMDTSGGAAIAYDASTSSVIAYTQNDHALFVVDLVSGSAQILHQYQPNDPKFASLTGDPCPGSSTSYGVGCAGSGGIVPELVWNGCPSAGSFVELSIRRGLGGSFAVLVFGAQQANQPLGAGCSLLVSPLLPATITVPLSAGGPGQGMAAAGVVMPVLPPGITFTMQALIADPATGIGGSVTNGIEIFVQ